MKQMAGQTRKTGQRIEDIEMDAHNKTPRRLGLSVAALALLGACSNPIDLDLRGKFGGFSTADAALNAIEQRPAPDDRGVISYPNYQVAVAKRGDTVNDVATRIDLPAAELAKFNGLQANDPLRDGEVLALPRRVTEPAAVAPDGGVDIARLAGSAIDAAPATPSVQTTQLEPVKPAARLEPKPAETQEPVRHKVARGETAFTISRLYQVPVKALGEWNGLGEDFAIREGQFLLIPVAGAEKPKSAVAAAAEETKVSEPGEGSVTPTPPSAAKPLPQERVASLEPEPEEPAVIVDAPTRAAPEAAMLMPVAGSIIRDYQKGKNDGIDIAAKPGTPVVAAAEGHVAAITSDADQVPIIVVRHPDNILTVYANVDDIKVKKGDTVKRGKAIAEVRDGDNAYLHFEVRDGFDSVDPNPYLR